MSPIQWFNECTLAAPKRSGVLSQKRQRERTLPFSDRNLQFSTKKIMDSHNFTFASKFPQNGAFLA